MRQPTHSQSQVIHHDATVSLLTRWIMTLSDHRVVNTATFVGVP